MGVGRVDAPCWQYAELHEILHNLGAVQPDAPPQRRLHCTDKADVMCYHDYRVMRRADTDHASATSRTLTVRVR